MALDAFLNFAIGTLNAGITSGATSLTMSSGQGARFPAVSFNAVIWNTTDYTAPDQDPNVEIVRVTAISTDTFTITRGQEGTTAVAHNTGGKTYALLAGLTALTVNKLLDKSGDTMTGILAAIAGLKVNDSAIKTSAYTILNSDTVIRHDTTGGAFTLTLPLAANCDKQIIFISGYTAGANACTLAASGSDNIQSQGTSASTFNLGANASRAFIADAATNKWYRIM